MLSSLVVLHPLITPAACSLHLYLPLLSQIYTTPAMPRKKKENNSTVEGQKPCNSGRCTWSDAENAIMLKVLTEQKLLGNQSDNGWKGCVWKAVADELVKELGVNGPKKTPWKCRDHWTNVRHSWSLLFFTTDLYPDESCICYC